MPTQTQPPPRPDWSQANLSQALSDDLQRLFEIEIKYKVAAAAGMAFLGYVKYGEPSDQDLEWLQLAWYRFIVCDAY